jgi:hypothetical protein
VVNGGRQVEKVEEPVDAGIGRFLFRCPSLPQHLQLFAGLGELSGDPVSAGALKCQVLQMLFATVFRQVGELEFFLGEVRLIMRAVSRVSARLSKRICSASNHPRQLLQLTKRLAASTARSMAWV